MINFCWQCWTRLKIIIADCSWHPSKAHLLSALNLKSVNVNDVLVCLQALRAYSPPFCSGCWQNPQTLPPAHLLYHPCTLHNLTQPFFPLHISYAWNNFYILIIFKTKNRLSENFGRHIISQYCLYHCVSFCVWSPSSLFLRSFQVSENF